MTSNQRTLLLLSGTLAIAGFVVGWPRLSRTQQSLALDLVNIGLVGTVLSVPVGLLVVPRTNHWVAAAILTALGYAVKAALLPHEGHATPAPPPALPA